MTNVSPCSSFSLSAWRWCKFIPFYFCIQDPDPSYNIQCQNTRMVFFKHWTTGILWKILLIYNVSLSYIREEKRKDNDKMTKKRQWQRQEDVDTPTKSTFIWNSRLKLKVSPENWWWNFCLMSKLFIFHFMWTFPF